MFNSRVICVFVWIVGLVWLLAHGRYQAFIRTDFWPLLAIAIAVLLVFLFVCTSRKAGEGCADYAQQSGLRRWIGALLVLLPLWLAFWGTTERSLNSDAFAQRWVDTKPAVQDRPSDSNIEEADADTADVLTEPQSEAPAEKVVEVEAEPAESDPVIEVAPQTTPRDLTLLELFNEAEYILGERVTTIGRVHRADNQPDRQFVLFRFVMNCCAADAQPMGVPVRLKSESVTMPERDQWVRVEGTILEEKIDGYDRYVLDVDTVVEIEAPRSPYLQMEMDW